MRDWSLKSGERQTTPYFPSASACHRPRYEWAAQMVGPVARGADIFCATGYGTAYLAEQCGGEWYGLDGSEEAVAIAEAAHPALTFADCIWPNEPPVTVPECDVVVCLESLEHVEDAIGFLLWLRAVAPRLVLSVPNEEKHPCSVFRNRFHARHYTPDGLRAILSDAGYRITGEYSQNIHAIIPTPEGMRRRGKLAESAMGVYADPAWASSPCCLLVTAEVA
jgi:SAM-dependent methyltransferase